MFRAFVREELWSSLVGSLVCLAWLAAQLPAAEPEDDPFSDKPKALITTDAPKATPTDEQLPAEAAPAKSAARQPRPTPQTTAAAKIHYALQDPTAMDFTETPLQDAIDYLKDLHNIPIQLDTRALEDAGVGSDTPVTFHSANVGLAPAMRLLLAPLQLAAVVKDDVLLITTVDVIQNEYALRVYDVRDLVEQGDKSLPETLRKLIDPPSVTVPKPDSPGAAQQAPVVVENQQVQFLAYRNLLLVRASLSDHERLEQLLADMRAVLGTID